MPIIEKDPWRLQYFEGIACSEQVRVPTDDALAFELNPRHRWVYDKRRIAQTQALPCGTREEPPAGYPVFCKPLMNLSGMGVGIHVLENEDDLRRYCGPGHFWMPLFHGDHISTDIAMQDGEPRWTRHVHGIAGHAGTFDYWIIEAAGRGELTLRCHAWLRQHLPDYTGMVNMETIGGSIIEVHLRFADQWPDLYGEGWIEAVVGLYTHRTWRHDEAASRNGYSVVLFGPHGRRYQHLSPERLREIRSHPGVSSVQITFDEARRNEEHAMPPGGFRLAIVNCWDPLTGFALREQLRAGFAV